MRTRSLWIAVSVCGCLPAIGRADEPEPPEKPSVEAGAPAAAAAPQAATKSDDDDWNSGPVDKTVHLSGVLSTSFRATRFDSNALPDGTKVLDTRDFQIEHVHLKISGDLSSHLSYEVMPCLMHMDSFSVVTANVSYQLGSWATLTAGRFLLPFGQFNLRSLPGQFDTVSRPLLYQSHEDDMIQFEGATPASFIFTPRDDTGIEANGNLFFGTGDAVQVSYAAYLTNGLRALSNTGARFWNDNNFAKQYGGRMSVSYNGDVVSGSAGSSYLFNRYEGSLAERAWGFDAVVAVQYRPQRRVHVRGEWVEMDRRIQPTAELLEGTEGTRGGYVEAEVDLLGWLGAYYQWDVLTGITPHAQLDEQFHDERLTTTRHVVGARFSVDGVLDLRAEYGRWIEPVGVPSANRIAVQAVVPF